MERPLDWTMLNANGTMPPGGCCSSLVHYARKLWLFGGGVVGCASKDIYSLDLDTLGWERITPAGDGCVSPRLNHSAVVHESSMIVFGGVTLSGEAQLSLDNVSLLRFHFEHLSWQALEATGVAPIPRRCHTAVLHGGKMYVLMGYSQLGQCDDMWALDLAAETPMWEELPMPPGTPARPPLPLFGHAACVRGDEMLVFGGMSGVSPSTYSNRLHGFNFKTRLWTEYRPSMAPSKAPYSGPRRGPAAAPVPPPRYSNVCWVDAGGLYVHGGDANRCTVYFDDLWRFDFETSRWEELTFTCGGPRPGPRSGHSVAAVDGVAYLFAGELPVDDPRFVRYSSNMFALAYSFPISAPLRDLSARWMLVSGFEIDKESDDEELEEPSAPSLTSGGRWALQKYASHPSHRHLPRSGRVVATETDTLFVDAQGMQGDWL